MSGFNLRNLDTNNPGGWPTSVKLFFCMVVAIVILFLGWYLFISDQQNQLESLERAEKDLRQQFEKKQADALNLEPLKRQLAQMEGQLQELVRELPSKTEMPKLIEEISQKAVESGILNELFQPQPESKKEFYAEKPITLRMVGTYHQFGRFVSEVANEMERVVIMTMHDISLKPRTGSDALVLEGTVKTYRYLDADETAGAATATPSTGGR